MTIYIALIRGINVGGHNLIKMQDLRNSLKSIGLGHVQTYIQSGNIVFQSEDKPEKLKLQIEQVIKSEFGFLVPVNRNIYITLNHFSNYNRMIVLIIL